MSSTAINRNGNWFALGVLFVWTGCTGPSTPGVPANDAVRVPDALRAAVKEQVALMVERGTTPRWAGAVLDERAVEAFKPGTPEPAYFQFRLTRNGSPAGYIIARNLNPPTKDLLVRFAEEGQSPIDDAVASAHGQSIRTIYLLDAFAAAAEDAQGNLLGDPQRKFLFDGADGARRAGSWQELKAAAPRSGPQLTPQTTINECAGCSYTPQYAVTHYSDVGGAIPIFSQLAPNQWPNTSSCWSGCGPEAWTMVLAWISNEAARNPSGPWGQYAGLGGAMPTAAAGQPMYDTPYGVANLPAQYMSLELHNLLGTMCFSIFGTGLPSDAAPTWPTDMINITQYFPNHYYRTPPIYSDAVGQVAYLTGFRSDRYAYEAADQVDLGNPAVLGFASAYGDHYAVGLRREVITTSWTSSPASCGCDLYPSDTHYLYIASGWDSAFWIGVGGSGAFYAGAFSPPPPLPPPPPDCTVSGCRTGLVCCSCTSTCTTASSCKTQCSL